MAGPNSLAMTVFGIVSLQGYLLMALMLYYYVRYQGRDTPEPAPSYYVERLIAKLKPTSSGSETARPGGRGTSRVLPGSGFRPGSGGSTDGDRACPHCGAINEEEFAFCWNCAGKIARR